MQGSKSRLSRPVISDPSEELSAWLAVLEELVQEVRSWAGPDWATELVRKPMKDSVLGNYSAPGLRMQRDFTRVILEPIARFAPGADGVVDLARMPAYDQVANLYRIDRGWKLYYPFQGPKPVASVRSAESLPLDEASLRRVLDEFTGHAT